MLAIVDSMTTDKQLHVSLGVFRDFCPWRKKFWSTRLARKYAKSPPPDFIAWQLNDIQFAAECLDETDNLLDTWSQLTIGIVTTLADAAQELLPNVEIRVQVGIAFYDPADGRAATGRCGRIYLNGYGTILVIARTQDDIALSYHERLSPNIFIMHDPLWPRSQGGTHICPQEVSEARLTSWIEDTLTDMDSAHHNLPHSQDSGMIPAAVERTRSWYQALWLERSEDVNSECIAVERVAWWISKKYPRQRIRLRYGQHERAGSPWRESRDGVARVGALCEVVGSDVAVEVVIDDTSDVPVWYPWTVWRQDAGRRGWLRGRAGASIEDWNDMIEAVAAQTLARLSRARVHRSRPEWARGIDGTFLACS